MTSPLDSTIGRKGFAQSRLVQILINATFTREELQAVVDTSKAIERDAVGHWCIRIDLGYFNERGRQSDYPMLVATLANQVLPKASAHLTVCWFSLYCFSLRDPEDSYEFGLPSTKSLNLMNENM